MGAEEAESLKSLKEKKRGEQISAHRDSVKVVYVRIDLFENSTKKHFWGHIILFKSVLVFQWHQEC